MNHQQKIQRPKISDFKKNCRPMDKEGTILLVIKIRSKFAQNNSKQFKNNLKQKSN